MKNKFLSYSQHSNSLTQQETHEPINFVGVVHDQIAMFFVIVFLKFIFIDVQNRLWMGPPFSKEYKL